MQLPFRVDPHAWIFVLPQTLFLLWLRTRPADNPLKQLWWLTAIGRPTPFHLDPNDEHDSRRMANVRRGYLWLYWLTVAIFTIGCVISFGVYIGVFKNGNPM